MIFSSLQYLLFLPVVVFLYWRLSGLSRLILVVVASYFFYMSWLPVYGVLLFVLSTANWLLALAMDSVKQRSQNIGSRTFEKLLLAFGLLLNLGSLCYYKYANFFLSNLAYSLKLTKSVSPNIFSWVPNWDAPILDVILPLGISFFVFEFVHYLVDIYRGDKPIKSWLEFTAFAAFFPSQIAGPIKRYQDFLTKLRVPNAWSSSLFNEGMSLMMQGFFKKVAIADPIGSVVYLGFSTSHVLSFPDALIASIGFVIQVYCDFSGYTDIGRGSALLLGIRLPENFQLPYLAHDLGDFWRRWHMSLSYWLRDYVYIPLGGSRVNWLLNWRNLFITMVACGLWHGADWHYVIFGCMQGIGLIINREWRNLLEAVKPLSVVCNTFVGKQLGTLLTMSYITLSYIVFRAPNMQQGFFVLDGLLNFQDMATALLMPVQKSGCLYFLLAYLAYWRIMELLKRNPQLINAAWALGLAGRPENSLEGTKGLYFPAAIRCAAWTAAVVLMITAKPVVPVPFVYFQF